MNRNLSKIIAITSHCGFVKEVNEHLPLLSEEQIEYEIEILHKDIRKLTMANGAYHNRSIEEIIVDLKLNVAYLETILAEKILLK